MQSKTGWRQEEDRVHQTRHDKKRKYMKQMWFTTCPQCNTFNDFLPCLLNVKRFIKCKTEQRRFTPVDAGQRRMTLGDEE